MRDILSIQIRCIARAASVLSAVSIAMSPGVSFGAEAPSFVCQVFASERIELASPVEGVLDTVLVDRGAIVHKGDVVATLNTA